MKNGTHLPHFEVIDRDGAARIGELQAEKKRLRTPCVIDASEIGGRRVWSDEESQNESLSSFKALPYLPMPFRTPIEVIDESREVIEPIKPSNSITPGVVIHPKGVIPDGFSLYILGSAADLMGNQRAFTSSIIRVREEIPYDSALYTPALANSYNLALLIYAGVDIVDYTQAIISAYQDRYFTRSGSISIQSLRELPCRCEVCTDQTPQSILTLSKKERGRLLEEHNRAKMDEEMTLIRELIRRGQLRDYIESTCRVEPWQTASLQHFDYEHTYLEKRTPIIRSARLNACTGESLKRVEVQRFAERVKDRYTPPELDILLLLPCSSHKPYSTSPSHRKIRRRLRRLTGYIHEVMITSPLGIVPRELELTYPAAHYDTPVTGNWNSEEEKFAIECLSNYLTQHHYKTIIAHVTGAYKEICREVSEKLSQPIKFTAENDPTSSDSLEKLEREIKSTLKPETPRRSPEEAKKEMMRAIADYQFGRGTGSILIPPDATVRAPYPRYQAHHKKEQLATLVPQYGTLALTIDGAKRMIELENYRVKIDEFTPRGTILAPGIIHADPMIRPGDEVLITNKKILAVGRAKMSGEEMTQSKRGIAIDLRHVARW
ncbi:Archaeosine synthase [Candidatus Methanoperedenaceae archaeon GB37]|nr:Archaeosine synthase [Candidatus Methanoperedenaceae archaeon GB37]